MTELKPCPFCGCRVYLSRDDGFLVYLEHPESDCIGYKMSRYTPIRQSRMGRAEFIEKWNRRDGEPQRCCTNCIHWKDYWDYGSDADEDYGNGDCNHFKKATAYNERCPYWEMKTND